MKLYFSAGWPRSHSGLWSWRSFALSQSSGWDNISPSTEGIMVWEDRVPSSQLPRCHQWSTSITARMAGQDILKQTDTKSKQRSGFCRPAVCVQLKKFSGWLLHSFEIAILGERAAFTYKYPFACNESAL